MVDVDDEIEPAEQRLVRADGRQAAAGKTVDHEGRNAHGIELVHPGFHGGADAARSVHQHHDGQFSAALRDAEFASDGDLLAVAVAAQKLLVGNRQRGDRVNFDTRGHLFGYRLRAGLDAGQQNGGTKGRGRHGEAPVCDHRFPPVFFGFDGELDQAPNGLSNPVPASPIASASGRSVSAKRKRTRGPSGKLARSDSLENDPIRASLSVESEAWSATFPSVMPEGMNSWSGSVSSAS